MNLLGKLLVATPRLQEPTFRRTVIFIVESSTDGSAGVVVNRPLTTAVSAVLPRWNPFVTIPAYLFSGGPVGSDFAMGLATVPGSAAPVGVRTLAGSIGVIDLESPPEIVACLAAGLRVFVGYCGWSPGQLDREIVEGSWYVIDVEPHDVFTHHPESLWREVLRRQYNSLALLSTYPDDVVLN